jgi:hypothetical protein
MDSVYQITAGHSPVEEKIAILSAGVPFEYAIPYFDVLAVVLRQIKVERQLKDQIATERFDAFIRNDATLNCTYPTSFFVTDSFFIEVWDNFVVCV